MSVAEDSKLSGEDESMSASVLHTALDELEEHLGAAEDLLRDGDEAGALEHIGDAEALLATREGWQAVDGVRRHAGRHLVLVRKSATLLACRRPRDAMAAADDALRHGLELDHGVYVAEAQLQRATIFVAAKKFGDAEAALASGIGAAPEAAATVDLRVLLASIKSISTSRFKATTLACRKPMSYSPKREKTDIFLKDIPLGDRKIFIGGPSLVSAEGFMRRKHNPDWVDKKSQSLHTPRKKWVKEDRNPPMKR